MTWYASYLDTETLLAKASDDSVDKTNNEANKEEEATDKGGIEGMYTVSLSPFQ